MDWSIFLLDLVLVIVSIGLLWKGSEWLVTSAAKLAHAWGVSDLVIGLTVVAIGTSAPEFAVTISAVVMGLSDISVSNVVGSNIFNLGFILGGTAAFHAITTSPKVVYRDGFFLIFITLLLGFFLFDAKIFNFFGDSSLMGTEALALSRWEGIVLLVLLFLYLGNLFIKKEPLEDDEIPHDKVTLKDYGLLIIGIACVVGGGHLLVDHASNMARVFGVSDWVIGVTIVAAGTSTPELATAIMAIIKGKHGMAIGNLIGSDIFNLLGVLGVAGVINDSIVVSQEAQSSILLLIGMMVLVVIFMRTGWKISRLQGSTLVLLNLVRWFYDFLGKGG